MNLIDIINRKVPPTPWEEGDNIPWNDIEFSQRMLREHLSQEHDAASRRFTTINHHVGWIHCDLLVEKPSHILDLGCGPGLYTNRLAELGHTCIGIDFSPASIQFARQTALSKNLACSYLEQDLRLADYGSDYDLVMLIYGEFNVFSPQDAGLVLDKAFQALKPGGLLLLEVHTFDTVWQIGHDASTWSARQSGLFSNQPHLLLEEGFWDEQSSVATRRYYVVDAATGTVSSYAASYQAYTVEEYRLLLEQHGYNDVRFFLDLSGGMETGPQDFIALVARKGAV